MNPAPIFEEGPVHIQKVGTGEALFKPPSLLLWIGEGDPDFIYLISSKKRVDEIDACA